MSRQLLGFGYLTALLLGSGMAPAQEIFSPVDSSGEFPSAQRAWRYDGDPHVLRAPWRLPMEALATAIGPADLALAALEARQSIPEPLLAPAAIQPGDEQVNPFADDPAYAAATQQTVEKIAAPAQDASGEDASADDGKMTTGELASALGGIVRGMLPDASKITSQVPGMSSDMGEPGSSATPPGGAAPELSSSAPPEGADPFAQDGVVGDDPFAVGPESDAGAEASEETKPAPGAEPDDPFGEF